MREGGSLEHSTAQSEQLLCICPGARGELELLVPSTPYCRSWTKAVWDIHCPTAACTGNCSAWTTNNIFWLQGNIRSAAVYRTCFIGGSFFSAFTCIVPHLSLHHTCCWDKWQWNLQRHDSLWHKHSESWKVSIATEMALFCYIKTKSTALKTISQHNTVIVTVTPDACLKTEQQNWPGFGVYVFVWWTYDNRLVRKL